MRVLLVLIFLVAGCGSADTECDCPEYDFFAEQYAPCIEACEAGIEWLDACGVNHSETVDSCVQAIWAMGWTARTCAENTKCVQGAITRENCPDWAYYQKYIGDFGWIPVADDPYCPGP